MKGRPIIGLEGQRVGRLTVLSIDLNHGKPTHHRYWNCKCDCGTLVSVRSDALRNRRTPTHSCGCIPIERSTTHGMRHSKVWATWRNIIYRCRPTSKFRHIYYDRGIGNGFDSFEAFYAEAGDPPTPKHSIDRIDNSRGYEPGNIRWATAKEQSTNSRLPRILEFNGLAMNATEWAAHLGHKPGTIHMRLRRGWPIEHVLS